MTITTQNFTNIYIGANPNDGTGDDLRTAFYKVDSNFSNITAIGFNAGNILSAGTVQAVNFVGNGAGLTGVIAYASNYSNSNVASYLPTYSGNIGALTVLGNAIVYGNVVASGNVSGLYVFGNGAFLTGLPASYANANVTAYLVSNSNAVITTTGGINSYGIVYANAGTQSSSTGTGALVVKGGVGISGNLVVGNLQVLGTTSYVFVSNVTTSNTFIFLANTNSTNVVDIGFVGQYNAGQGTVYTGLAYHAADGIYRLFSNLTPAPTTTVTLTNAVYSNIQVGNILAANVLATNFIGSGAYLTTLPGYAYSNINVAAYLGTVTGGLYSNVNTAAYTQTMGYTNYSNVNVAAYLNTQGYNLYSNVNVAAYISTYTGNITAGNIYLSNGSVSTGTYTGAYSDGIVVDYVNNKGRISVGTGDGITLYNNGVGGANLLAIASNGATTITGNVTAPYYFGNGSQLSGIPTAYSNSSVAVFLGNLNSNNISTLGNVSANYISANAVPGSTSVFSVGYMNYPQNYLGSVTPNYTLQLTDQGHHLLSSITTRGNIYIPTYANVAFPIGSSMLIVNYSTTGNLSIIGNTGVTFYLAGNTISGSNTRVMSAGGMGTLLNLAANVWIISGTGIS